MSQQPLLSAASDANSDTGSDPGSGSRRSISWQHNPFSQFKTKLSQPRSSLRPSCQGSYASLTEAALEAQSTASLSTAQSGSRRPGTAHSQAHGFNARAVAKVKHQKHVNSVYHDVTEQCCSQVLHLSCCLSAKP
jgi:hypothetical protein